MKALFISNSSAGMYSFRREVIEAVAKEAETFFCAPADGREDCWKELGCSFIPYDFDRHGTNPVTELTQIRYYKDLLGKVKPDIVFTYTIKPNVYGGMACASLGIPYAANITGLGTALENGGAMQKIGILLYKRGLRKAQKVFFQNEANRDFMVNRGIVKGAYDLLPGSGVNLEQYAVSPYPDGETVDFIFVARIMKEKGIDQYLDAAKAIRAKHPETRFHICGACEQDYEGTLKELENNGTVIYHGPVRDMKAIYQMAACTVHPTYYPEGMSNVLLESAASGRPIITTDRSGCREIVDDGINGFVVRQQDSADLIEKIEKFLALSPAERKAMGLAGRAKVERQFDRKIVIGKYLDELHKVRN